jgi:PII-like signaling protein
VNAPAAFTSYSPADKPHIVCHAEYEQGSEQWLQARCGLLTASEVKLIINPPPKEETRVKKNGEPYKQREWTIAADDEACRKHIYELAAQRITKFVEPMFQSFDMIRGQADEQEARALYSERYAPVQEVGFMTNNRWGFTLGYSPDGLVGDDGAIECKSRKQKFQVQTVVEHLRDGGIPGEFVMQHQTGLLVSERAWIDFISFSARLPMAVIRVHPDDVIQAAIREAAEIAEAKIADIIKTFQEATQ